MSIIFHNPNDGSTKIVQENEATEISPGVFAMVDQETGETMMGRKDNAIPGGIQAEMRQDMPLSPEDDLENQIASESLNMIENAELRQNPPARILTWKNLRLQSAIFGEKAVKLVTAPKILSSSLTKLNQQESVRDSPQLMQLATSEDWAQYVRNMSKNPVDMGAELSTTVSASQKIAVTKFIAEWERDPGHANLLKKSLPGANPNDVLFKGQIAFDLITGRGPNPLQAKGYGTFKYDKMFRLAYDIISTLPIRSYNSYTLFQLAADEGETAFREAIDRYVPLETSEVGLVMELERKLAEYGPGYAQVTIPDPVLAVEASKLMSTVVNSYRIGDTSTTRSALNHLMDSPFYYASPAAEAKNIFTAEGEADAKYQALAGFNKSKFKDSPAPAGVAAKEVSVLHNGLLYVVGFPQANVGDNNKPKDLNSILNKVFEVIRSPFDTTVIGTITWYGKKNENFTYSHGATLNKTKNLKERRDAVADMADALRPNPRGNSNAYITIGDPLDMSFEDASAATQKLANETGKTYQLFIEDHYWDEMHARDVSSWIATTNLAPANGGGDIIEPQLNNPRGKPIGRGKFYYVQIHPKSQLLMSRKETTSKGKGDVRHGSTPPKSAGGQNKWMKGLYKVLQDRIDIGNRKQGKGMSNKQKFPDMGAAVTGGKHKKTGEWVPYLIKLPKSHFKMVRHPSGFQTVGLKKGKGDKELLEAWRKFTNEYGSLERKPSASIDFLFKPKAEEEYRGAYQDRHRRKVGDAKRSR